MESSNDQDRHSDAARRRRPLRPPDPPLEPQDEALHLRQPWRHLHPRPQEDAASGLDDAYTFMLRDLRARAAPSCSSAPRSRLRSPSPTLPTRCGMPYVNSRWLGGMLTNFVTIRTRVHRMEELEAMEADGRMALLPKKEQILLRKELAKLQSQPQRHPQHEAHLPDAVFVVDTNREDDRHQGGPSPEHPRRGHAGHQLRSRRRRVRHPRQRRRHPLGAPAGRLRRRRRRRRRRRAGDRRRRWARLAAEARGRRRRRGGRDRPRKPRRGCRSTRCVRSKRAALPRTPTDASRLRKHAHGRDHRRHGQGAARDRPAPA